MDLKVLYEDNHLIAVFKPNGIPVQGDLSGDKCLMDFVKDYLKTKYAKAGNVYLGLLHRLDRPVSGIVLFAKTSKGASRLSEQIRNRTIEKKYSVLVDKKPPKDADTLTHYLVKNSAKNKSWAYDEPRANSKEAVLKYQVLEDKPDGKCLLAIDLLTGRHHQIRAQLAAIGCSIVGDSKYGSKYILGRGAICLSATYLKFKKATEDEFVELSIDAEFVL